MIFCASMLRDDVEQPFHATKLRRLFGNYSTPDTLASWLYSNLMQQTLWYSKEHHQPYSYRVNADGWNKIMKMLEEAEKQA
jgi:hypothetical protein